MLLILFHQAELIDNSIDATANRLDIDVEFKDGAPMLIFTDNGYSPSPCFIYNHFAVRTGLNAEQMHRMLSFGHCGKDEKAIGRYGNGFKSGSMRVGQDAIVFTRRDDHLTVGFLSQTFLFDIGATEVLVPMVTWDANTFGISFYPFTVIINSYFQRDAIHIWNW